MASPVIRITAETTVVVTGTGSGATAIVEGIITLPSCWSGRILGVRMRRTAGSGTPLWALQAKTGETDAAVRYAVIASAASAVAITRITVPPPFHNQDDPRERRLYAVFDNDTGAGDASTWAVSLEIEADMTPGGKLAADA